MLCGAMILSLAACGDKDGKESGSKDAAEVQKAFEQYLDDYFEDVVTSHTLTAYNTTIKKMGRILELKNRK